MHTLYTTIVNYVHYVHILILCRKQTMISLLTIGLYDLFLTLEKDFQKVCKKKFLTFGGYRL
jgi:hypothetical protein